MKDATTETRGVMLTVAILVACILMVSISYAVTPMNSGVPAAFGSIFQPLGWLVAAGCTALVTVLSVPLLILAYVAKSDSPGIGVLLSFAFLVAGLVFFLDLAQLLFAIFGPDI